MADQKPVILLVHGAWHPPKCYEKLQEELENTGFEYIAPRLPTLGCSQVGVTWKADVEVIQECAQRLFEEGKEVVIVGHSYGGIPACIATRGLGIAERRAQGRKGGLRRVIFLAAFAVSKHGTSLLETLGGTYPPWQIVKNRGTKGHMTDISEDAKDVFFNDLPQQEKDEAYKLLEPHSTLAFETAVPFVATEVTIPKTYIICNKDQALPTFLQEQLVSQADFDVMRLDSSHSPFLSQPEKCARAISDAAMESRH